MLGAGIGALGWFGLANRTPEPIQLESQTPPAVAGGPPTRAVRAEPFADVAWPGVEVGDEVVYEGIE
jgi:hypothetical protein